MDSILVQLIIKISESDNFDLVRKEVSLIYDIIKKELFNKIYYEFKKFIPPRLIEDLEEGFNNGILKFFFHIKLFDHNKTNNPIKWIYKIIKNEIYNYFKLFPNKKTLISLPVWDENSEKPVDIQFIEPSGTMDIIAANELEKLIEFFIDNDDYLKNNEQAKETFKLRYYENLNNTEIANLLNISNSTVTKYKKIIIKRFKFFLNKNGWFYE